MLNWGRKTHSEWEWVAPFLPGVLDCIKVKGDESELRISVHLISLHPDFECNVRFHLHIQHPCPLYHAGLFSLQLSANINPSSFNLFLPGILSKKKRRMYLYIWETYIRQKLESKHNSETRRHDCILCKVQARFCLLKKFFFKHAVGWRKFKKYKILKQKIVKHCRRRKGKIVGP